MKTRFLAYLTCVTLCLLGSGQLLLAADDTNVWGSKFIPIPDNIQGYGLPPYMIQVVLPDDTSTNQARNVVNYTLTDDKHPEKVILIKAVHLMGGKITPKKTNDENFPTNVPSSSTGRKWGGSLTAQNAELITVDNIDPTGSYTLVVHFGDTASPNIKVAAYKPAEPAEPDQSQGEVVRIFEVTSNLLSGRFTLTVDSLATLDAKKTPAFDYSASFDLMDPRLVPSANGNNGWLYSLSLASEGTISLNSADTNINQHLSFSASGQGMYIYQVKDPLSNGELAYYAGFRLKGAEIESDQRFKVVNYTLKPEVALWVPWSNLPGLWWSRAIGIEGNPATPLCVYAGYAYVDAIKTDSAKVSSSVQKSDRLETEFAYALPLTSNLRVGTRVRLFWLFDDHSFKNYEELYVRRYLDAKKMTSIEFK